MKALALLSGGLDSTLAVKLILKRGIDVGQKKWYMRAYAQVSPGLPLYMLLYTVWGFWSSLTMACFKAWYRTDPKSNYKKRECLKK
jgi:hypothetical protein